MEIKKVLITPKLAEVYLQGNKNNRTPKPAVINRYSNDIANGLWREDTGEMIKISKNGNILDGQHRLMAIIKANKSVNLHVITGLEEKIFDVIDSGISRTAYDVFYVRGVKNAGTIPAILNKYFEIKENKQIGKVKTKSNQELLNFYLAQQDYWNDIAIKSTTYFGKFSKIIPVSYIGSLFAVFSEKDYADAVKFFDQLCTGNNITNSTIAILRTKLLEDKLSDKKVSQITKYAWIIKTWNAFRENKQLRSIKHDGPIPPII